MQTIDIKTLSEVELKALGYEQVKLLQSIQNNINAIEQELRTRQQTVTNPE